MSDEGDKWLRFKIGFAFGAPLGFLGVAMHATSFGKIDWKLAALALLLTGVVGGVGFAVGDPEL